MKIKVCEEKEINLKPGMVIEYGENKRFLLIKGYFSPYIKFYLVAMSNYMIEFEGNSLNDIENYLKNKNAKIISKSLSSEIKF